MVEYCWIWWSMVDRFCLFVYSQFHTMQLSYRTLYIYRILFIAFFLHIFDWHISGAIDKTFARVSVRRSVGGVWWYIGIALKCSTPRSSSIPLDGISHPRDCFVAFLFIHTLVYLLHEPKARPGARTERRAFPCQLSLAHGVTSTALG